MYYSDLCAEGKIERKLIFLCSLIFYLKKKEHVQVLRWQIFACKGCSWIFLALGLQYLYPYMQQEKHCLNASNWGKQTHVGPN